MSNFLAYLLIGLQCVGLIVPAQLVQRSGCQGEPCPICQKVEGVGCCGEQKSGRKSCCAHKVAEQAAKSSPELATTPVKAKSTCPACPCCHAVPVVAVLLTFQDIPAGTVTRTTSPLDELAPAVLREPALPPPIG